MNSKLSVCYRINTISYVHQTFHDWFDFADWLKQQNLAGRVVCIRSWVYVPLMLVIFLWPMIGQAAQIQEGYSAYARYRHSSKHHHKAARRTHHERRDRNAIYDPDRTVRLTLAQDDEFTAKKAPVTYPFTTGTSVLDKYEGRQRLIEDNSCLNPWRDMDYYLSVDAFAAY